MENEENRGLIHKMAFEDQLVTFCQMSFGAFSLFSLSYFWTLRVSWRNFGIGARKAKKARGSKDQAWKGMFKQLQQASLKVSTCMCIFLTIFGMHGITCGSFLSRNGFGQV